MGREKSLQSLNREEKVRRCPDCGSTSIDYRQGEEFCKKCGLVITE